MAKITVAGDAIVVTSALKMEDIKTVEKYNPDALVLMGGEDGKEPVFRVATTSGDGNIGQYGASFGRTTEGGLACVTIVDPKMDGNIKEYVADKFGTAITQLEKIEAAMPDVLTAIAADKAKVMEHITVM